MALPDEIHVGKTYVSPRWQGARTVSRLERKNGLLSGARKTEVHFVCQKSGRTGHSELSVFARSASVQDLLTNLIPEEKPRRARRLSSMKLRALLKDAGIELGAAAPAESIGQFTALATGLATCYSEQCRDLGLKLSTGVGSYAAGKKAGAFECAERIASTSAGRDLLTSQSPGQKVRRARKLSVRTLRNLVRHAKVDLTIGQPAPTLDQFSDFADAVALHYSEKCNDLALEFQEEPGTYAAGKKAGALECAQLLSR